MFEVIFSFYVSEQFGENSAGYWSQETKIFEAYSQDDLDDQAYRHMRAPVKNHHHKRILSTTSINKDK